MTRPADAIALATDLYQLTMGASYAALGMDRPATFSLFARKLPGNRSYAVAAGLAGLLERIHDLRFDDDALEYLHSTGQIREDFLEVLARFRFTGDIWAVPEGSLVFANEPIIEVHAPILEAQLLETLAINAVHFSTAVATKAARCVGAAPGATLVDFGLRRTPSIDAGLEVARVTYLSGFVATSNVLAGRCYSIPVAGTVAHSFIESFPSELDAFRAFARTFPGPVTLLIDTYDTLLGAKRAVQVARELAAEGKRVAALRLDSGDLATLSRQVRAILDEAGLTEVRLIASGGLDEYELARLTTEDAAFDIYGVGTRVGTSADAPMMDFAYKLVEYDGRPTLKLSTDKQSLVGPKQIWRRCDSSGRLAGDLIAARDEPCPGPDWEPLLAPVVTDGRIHSLPSLAESRAHHQAEIARLPDALRVLEGHGFYPVELSPELQRRQHSAVEATRRREGVTSDQ